MHALKGKSHSINYKSLILFLLIKGYTSEFHSNVCYAILPYFYSILLRLCTLSADKKLYNEDFPLELQ